MKKNIRHLIADVLSLLGGNSKNLPPKDNYDSNDTIVETFYSVVNDDVVKKYPNITEEIVDNLDHTVFAESLATLRYAYQNLQKVIDPEDDATLVEDLDINLSELNNDAKYRLQSSYGLDRYAELNPDVLEQIDEIQTLILEGKTDSIKQAKRYIKTLYASMLPGKNIRVAYTTLNTQDNEPYQLCPKAEKQIGYAIPMELSKCRDNCIDSRRLRTGETTCAYQDWMKVVADNQESVLARLAKQKLENTIENSLNEIDRPGPADYETKNYNMLIEEADKNKKQRKYYKQDEIIEQSLEENLDKRELNTKQAGNSNRVITANTVNNYSGDQTMAKKFNLQEYTKAQSINDKLDKFRDFFVDTLKSEAMPEVTNRDRGSSAYESPTTSMEELVSRKHGEVPDGITQEEQLAKKRKGDTEVHTKTQEESVNARRKNESEESFMQTLEEKLEKRRVNKE
jgi:hypothetical protein